MCGKNVMNKRLQLDVAKGQDGREMVQWLCVPLLHNVIDKMTTRSKGNNSKYRMFVF